MTRADIILAVKAKMDEIHPTSSGDTIVDPQINAQLDSSAVSLLEMLPSSISIPVSPATLPTVTFFDHGICCDVECPADFLKLHRIRLDHWIRSVTDLYPDGDRLFHIQDYKHVRSTIRRPVASIYYNDGWVITCYPPPEPTVPPTVVSVAEFLYVPTPAKAEDLNDSLIEMLLWNTAATVYAIAGKGDYSTLCQNKLAAIIERKVKYGRNG